MTQGEFDHLWSQWQPRRRDTVVAYTFFGWRWFSSPHSDRLIFLPPELDGWERIPWGPNFTEVSFSARFPWPDTRYRDWDGHGLQRDANRNIVFRGLPPYTTEIRWAWDVREHVRQHTPCSFREVFLQNLRIPDSLGWPHAFFDVDAQLICKAAMAARVVP